jgi:hypothetical protein
MIQCPECRKQISEKALVCVGCGRPLRSTFWEKTASLSKTIFLYLLVYIGLLINVRYHAEIVTFLAFSPFVILIVAGLIVAAIYGLGRFLALFGIVKLNGKASSLKK